jgi:anti-anti-sigma factor
MAWTPGAVGLAEKEQHMFEISLGPAGEVAMIGRLDATHCDAALAFLNGLPDPHVIDLGALQYIASAGLRVLLLTQKRMKAAGGAIRLVNVGPQIYDIFRYAGFDRIIDVVRVAS